MLAVCGFCVCMTSVSFAQTTQPGQDEPKQEQPPPEDSPEPLGNARRPYRGLFGGANTGSRRETIVNFNGSVAGVYDQDELGDDEASQLEGFYTNFPANLDYGRFGTRTEVSANGGANLRYYTQFSEFLAADYHAQRGREDAGGPAYDPCSSANRSCILRLACRDCSPIPCRRSWVIRCRLPATSQ